MIKLTKEDLLEEMELAINDAMQQAQEDRRVEWLFKDMFFLSFKENILTVHNPDDTTENYRLEIFLTKVEGEQR